MTDPAGRGVWGKTSTENKVRGHAQMVNAVDYFMPRLPQYNVP